MLIKLELPPRQRLAIPQRLLPAPLTLLELPERIHEFRRRRMAVRVDLGLQSEKYGACV